MTGVTSADLPHLAATEERPTAAALKTAALTVSIVLPALNEAAAISRCVAQASAALAASGLTGEVLVIDNGSTDGTAELARTAGARVASEPRRGYGRACTRGLREARGSYVLLLDADGTYPVELVGEFVRMMRDEGTDVVLGNRFGGLMKKGAMPLLNRYVGNPALSFMTRVLFGARLQDFHCGMRAMRRDRVASLDPQMPGMEFATEMVVKALDQGMVVRELSIPYAPRLGVSKLRPFRDAWRHVEYMLIFSPSVLLLWPGTLLFVLGLGLQTLLISGPRTLLFRTWDVHTNLAGLACALAGATLVVLGLVAANFGWAIGLSFRHSATARLVAGWGDRPVRTVAVLLALLGTGLWTAVLVQWVGSGFGALAAVPVLSIATTFLATGLELMVAAFLVHIVRLRAAADAGR